MAVNAEALVVALAYLLAKHCVVDFFLQTPYQYLNKGRYLHPGGLLHSGLHAVGSLPALLILAPSTMATGLMVIIGEALIHYHTDFAKDRISKSFGWTPQNQHYWNALGVDQLIHGLTYLAMVYVLVTHRL